MSYLRECWLRPLVTSGDMLSHRDFVVLTTLTFILHISSEQTYTNGWIPMTHNAIYDQIRRDSIQYPVYHTIRPPVTSDDSFEITQRKKDAMEELYDVNINSVKKKSGTSAFVNWVNNNYSKAPNNKEHSRKAKKLLEPILNNFVDDITETPTTDIEFTYKEEDNTTNDVYTESTNTYEVTEDTDVLFKLRKNDSTKDIAYQYSSPAKPNSNLTSNFYEILSKYNINAEDNLQNYDLSLQHKVQNPLPDMYRTPMQYRYNSLNHLPVDPLLAVFLSNYGFYLPSLYGVKSNYNNLYGYLASNNIHNNKPFGLYKIFSDTDSWN